MSMSDEALCATVGVKEEIHSETETGSSYSDYFLCGNATLRDDPNLIFLDYENHLKGNGEQDVANSSVGNSIIPVTEAASVIGFDTGEQCMVDKVNQTPLSGTSSSLSELDIQGGQHGGNVIPVPSNVDNLMNMDSEMEHKQELNSEDKIVMHQFWNDVQTKAVLRKAHIKMNNVNDRKNKIREGGKVFVDLTFSNHEIIHGNLSGKTSQKNPHRNKFNEEEVETINKILDWLLVNDWPSNITVAAFTQYERTHTLGLQGYEYMTFREKVFSKYASRRRKLFLNTV